jgi:hypothetical protein
VNPGGVHRESGWMGTGVNWIERSSNVRGRRRVRVHITSKAVNPEKLKGGDIMLQYYFFYFFHHHDIRSSYTVVF